MTAKYSEEQQAQVLNGFHDLRAEERRVKGFGDMGGVLAPATVEQAMHILFPLAREPAAHAAPAIHATKGFGLFGLFGRREQDDGVVATAGRDPSNRNRKG
ncbi:MAG: hypothetical protein A3J38_02310 [Gammaproteobacteria bacterium RIFCSPHIGHO2_12_FULL_45_9]|nr:MAG: hypothetical protein A3J38_02310 [Gammaproteobacteria bacterium RIFCSPHIGHO2_12_FULL_45_9]